MWSFIETTDVFLLSLMLTGRALRSSNVSCSSPSSHRSSAHTPSEYFVVIATFALVEDIIAGL
jgi:hypothetical protein